MIRRLHFEEAQPSPQAINPAGQSAEISDDQQNSSLALEFKELLEQLSGGMSAVSDQAIAVGLALAQAAPIERTVRHELKTSDTSRDSEDLHDDRDSFEDRDVTNKEAFLRMDSGDSGKRAEARTTLAEDGSENPETKTTTEDTTQEDLADSVATEVVDFGAFKDVSQDFLQTVSDTNNVVSVEVCSDSQSTTDSVEIAPVQIEEAKVIDDQQTVNFDVQTQVISHLETKVKKGGGEKEKRSEDELLDLNSVSASSVETGIEDFRREAGSLAKDALRELNDAATAPTIQSFEAEQFSVRDTLSGGGITLPKEALDNAAMLAQHKDLDGTSKSVKPKAETSISEPETVSQPVTKMANKTGEGTIQMTLLRQAFESLKAARQEGADGRAKPSAPAVATGVGAATEAKGAHNEASTRSGRAMTKGQTARTLERVEATLKEAARARDGKTISLRLDPANLGRVKVDVSLRDGSLHAKISPENQQVMVALRENAHDLQGALRKLGLHVDSVSVTVTSDYIKEEANTGQQMTDGRSFQQERNKMPEEKSQVVENTFGNELAERKEVVTPGQANAVVDHWVA